MLSSNRAEYPSLGMALLLFQLLMRLIYCTGCIISASFKIALLIPSLVQCHVQMERVEDVNMFNVCTNVDKGVTNFKGPLHEVIYACTTH